jgi:hypothetical protein
VQPEAGKDYEGSQMEVLETMKAAKFGVVNNKDTVPVGLSHERRGL